MREPVALIGLMASGKTSVGRLVAAGLGREFVDTDDLIVAATGKTVRELWEEGGEAAYRPLERDASVDAVRAEPPVVVGVPGGAVFEPEVRDALAGALVVWLRSRPETLAARVRPDDHRPLLQPDPLAAFTVMAAERNDTYASLADLVLDTDDSDAQELAAAILGHIEANA